MKLNDLLSNDVITSIAKAAGASKGDTTSVLATALPELVKSMASNASTKSGASSLAKALEDHASDASASSLLKNIDNYCFFRVKCLYTGRLTSTTLT